MDVGPVRVRVDDTAAAPKAAARPRGPMPIDGVDRVIAVASGKGGVGKSTVATNLAVALTRHLGRVGLLDADVYGPSVPVMLGVSERPRATSDKRIVPVTAHGLTVVSMGLFLGEDTPVIWRGPMLTKLLGEFVRNVEWGELDCLVLDLPPGTGDVQLTITQQVRLSGGVIVTTPQDVALLDVKRGITMFRQVNAPVIGVIENMSYHICPQCGARAEIFGHGGGARMAAQMDVAFLGEIPLYRDVRVGGDEGRPIVVSQPDHPASRAIGEIATRVVARLAEEPAPAHAP
jgi:ATP-binding protein involved in chromosome partitioning